MMAGNDILNNKFHLANTQDFLTWLFPVEDSIIERAYETLVNLDHDEGYDTRAGVWRGLSKDSIEKDLSYCAPFVKIAEAIRAANPIPDKVTLGCTWLERRGGAPGSWDRDGSIIRPAVLCALNMGSGNEQENWKACMNIEVIEEGTGEAKKEEVVAERSAVGEKKGGDTKEHGVRPIDAWWLRVNVPIEYKPVESRNTLMHVERLLGYMRRVLREQLDRYFVPGLLLSRTGLQVWLCDRSGVLGTQKAFNIHEDPKSLIRVILGCSLLPPERLGWDTTMRLCRRPVNPRNPEHVHSFCPSVTVADYGNSLYDMNWIIEMPSKVDPNMREQFITVRALNTIKVECMSGGATIVWAAIKVTDMKAESPPHKIHVLKQCWRPTAEKHEGGLFPDESETHSVHLGRVYSYEDVQHNGESIDTQNFVRRGLQHLPLEVNTTPSEKQMNNALEAAEAKEPGRTNLPSKSDQAQVNASTQGLGPTWRTFARLLLEDYGWPLGGFRDIPELLNVSEQALATHEILYFLGTLHGDISPGNVLICPSIKYGINTTEGRLIDLDNAKCVDEFIAPILCQIKKKKGLISNNPEMLLSARKTYETCVKANLSDDVVDMHGADYITESMLKAILEYNPDLRGAELSASDIGMLPTNRLLPNFSDRVAQNHRPRMTLPYASAEVLSQERMFAIRGTTFVHNAVHDLEAFFWVILSICITSNGPGGKLREELKHGFTSTSPQNTQLSLVQVADHFFRTEDIQLLIKRKKYLFQAARDEFEKSILPHVHPYFDILKPLLLQWWKILGIAHEFPCFEAVHGWFLAALRKAISEVKAHPPKTDPRSAEVDAFRREDLRWLQYFPHRGPTSQGSKNTASDLSPARDASKETALDVGETVEERAPPPAKRRKMGP